MITHLIILLCLNYQSIMCESNNFGSVYIDSIANAYLNMEEQFWSSFNQSDLILKIHTEHLNFFRDAFSIEQRRTENYKSNFEKIYGWKVVGLNSEIEFVKNFELHDSIDDISVDDTIQLAKTYVDYTALIDKIYNLTVKPNIFEKIKEITTTQNCSSRSKPMESASLVLYHYYSDISTSLLKAYTLVQLSYMIFTFYGRKNYTTTSRNLRNNFKDYFNNIQLLAIEAMNKTDRNYWMCDGIYPAYFAQVTNFMQGYVDNEVNLNSEGSCYNTCSDCTSTKNYGCYDGTLCHLTGPKGKCNGTIHGSSFVESPLNICSEEGTSRRYSHIEYHSGHVSGKDKCDDGNIIKISSWNRWFVECSNCWCYCLNDKSDKYFSLQPVLSNKTQNKVITGVSLQKINGTFYWKIAEATLLRNGEVQSDIDDWVPVKGFNLADITVHDGYDYHTLSWESRAINMDVIMAPDDAVITGIRFKAQNGHLYFEIQATKFDFHSGQLYDSFEWISNLNVHRESINLDKCELPEKSTSFSEPNWQQNTFVVFQTSDIAHDVSQTTIPYIDTQLVEPSHPAPLAGIGIHYKGNKGFGGYIAPYLVTYDYLPHIVKSKT